MIQISQQHGLETQTSTDPQMAKDHPFNFGCHKCGFCEVKHVENDRSAIEIEWYYIVKPSRSISTYQHSISIGASWWFMCELHPFNPKNCHYSSVISITPNKLAPAIRSWPNEAPGTKSGYHSPKENWGNLPAAIPTRRLKKHRNEDRSQTIYSKSKVWST